MKFSEKLTKKRKDNNLSQEQLADKLGMSRQAISKWESGTSYPDMNTIMKLSEILNCTLDEILDDGVVNSDAIPKNNKFNILLKEFLNFITKTYNMFLSMKFKEKIKCLFEMAFLTFVYILLWIILSALLRELVVDIANIIPGKIIYLLLSFCSFIYNIIGIVLGIIVIIHLFKIRYLDYYVMIEDNSVTEKQEEKLIKENKNIEQVKYFQKPKEKIVIRDAKHSTFNFITFLGKIILFFLKIFALMLAMFVIFCLIICVIGSSFSVLSMQYGLIFLGILSIFLGGLLFSYSILELLYQFIFNQKYHFKRLFILLIISFVFVGSGLGISFKEYLSFDISNDYANEYIAKNSITKTKYIDMDDNIVLAFLNQNNVIIDNSLTNIKIEYIDFKSSQLVFEHYKSYNNQYETYAYYQDYHFVDVLNDVLDMIKNHQVIEEKNFYLDDVKIYISSENLKIIEENNRQYFYSNEYN